MTRTARLVLFLAGAGGMTVLIVLAVLRLPHFGATHHVYRDHAVDVAMHQRTANVVSNINFDQRGLDTLGEESILFAAVLGVSVLLRPAEGETERGPLGGGRTIDATKLMGYLMLPVTLIIGLDVIAHGHLTPGGGFQGGVVLGTGVHLVYVAGSYRALERARPVTAAEWGEALGAGAFASLGIAGVFVATAFLANIIDTGTFGELFSGGTVPLLNGAVGIEVASGVAVLLAKFLQQAIEIESPGEGSQQSGRSG